MKEILYELKVKTKNKIKVKKKGLIFTRTVEVPEVYEYWIEFRADEGRFWYGEYKPVLTDDYDIYEYKRNYIMTKNGLDKSIEIVEKISNRICELIFINELPNDAVYMETKIHDKLDAFERFDKKDDASNSKEKLHGIFLK